MEHSRARIVHTVAKYCTCALHMSQRGLPRTPCVCNCENVCFVRSLARQTAVRTIMPGARSHNALRTIVGIPLSGLEWFIHVDQLFLTERLTDQSTARARERSAGFHSPLLSTSRENAWVNYYWAQPWYRDRQRNTESSSSGMLVPVRIDRDS